MARSFFSMTASFRPRVALCALLVGCLMPVPARAFQSLVSLLPFDYEGDVYVTDSSLDKIFHLADLNLDGDYLDVGEVVTFYDDTFGPLPLSNNSSIAVGPGGRVYVTDRAEGWVLRMLDSDGDGKAETGGETTVFFDGDPLVNAAGLDVPAPLHITVDAQNVIWVAEAGQGGAGKDSVLRLQDLNLDGDANDVGEARRYYEPPMGTTDGDTVVADVLVGPDAFLYYVEASSTGFRPVGLYRMDDANVDGVIDPLTEVAPFFLVPTSPFAIFLQAGALDGNGFMYLTDAGNDVVWRVRDENGDGTIDPLLEARVYLVSPLSSVVWDLAPTADGRVLASELNGGARLLELDDLNGDGAIDITTELFEPYNSAIAAVSIANPRGLAWESRVTLDVPLTVTTGTVAMGTLAATEGDVATIYYSTGQIAPLPLAPFGFLELDPGAPAFFSLLTAGVVPSLSPLSFSIPVPSSPSFVGLVVYFQAVAGKADRLQLSNLDSLTIQ
jgi:hypothetical protein